MTEYEMNVLRHLDGAEQIGKDKVNGWGAALSVAIEFLHEAGYVSQQRTLAGITYVITQKGKAIIQ